MKTMLKTVLFAVLGVVLGVVLLCGVTWGGIEFYRFFGVKQQNAEREVFEQTKSYVHGKIQALSKAYGEYQLAKDDEEKAAITSVIKVQFAGFDSSLVKNPELRRFLIQTRGF